MGKRRKRPTLGEICLQHCIVFLICVVFPGLVTMMAPATWIRFERHGQSVRCTTRTCAFFVVPFQVHEIDPVREIGQRERVGRTERQREFGRTTNKFVDVDGQGFLQIRGEDEQLVEVSVSPVSLESVVSQCKAFLSESDKSTTTLFAIANWKFGALMGGILTSFTALYVVGYTLGLMKWIVMGFHRALRQTHVQDN